MRWDDLAQHMEDNKFLGKMLRTLGYRLDGPGIDSPWGARFSAPVQTGPGTHPASCTMGTRSFPGVQRPGRGSSHPIHLVPRLRKEYSYTSIPPIGRTACTELQCLYKGALYLYLRVPAIPDTLDHVSSKM